MKVIEEHFFDETFPMIITCRQSKDEYGFTYGEKKDFCGSVLEINAEDIKSHLYFKYPNLDGVDYGVICPVCGRFITVDKTKLPEFVINHAESIRLAENDNYKKGMKND